MTHLTPAAPSTAAILPTMLSVPAMDLARPAPGSRHLDRGALQSGIAARQRTLAGVESAMVAACEQAAARGAPRAVRIEDRESWDRATWQRYLDAATRLEPEYGPRLRRLYHEIDQLSRLVALPLAA